MRNHQVKKKKNAGSEGTVTCVPKESSSQTCNEELVPAHLIS